MPETADPATAQVTPGSAAGRPDSAGGVGPALRRRQLGRALRELRKERELSIREVADRTGISVATISRIESAKQVILPPNIRLLGQVYGVPEATMAELLSQADGREGRDQDGPLADAVPELLRRYVAEEADAEEIALYAAELVPDLFRTTDYATAVWRAAEPVLDPAELARRIALGRARQQRLTPRQRLTVVLNEAVLHRAVGGERVRRAQLAYLAECAARPNTTVLVLPFAAGAHPATAGSFALLRFPPGAGEPTVCLELDSGVLYLDAPAELARRSWMLGRLRELALSPEESVAMLRESGGVNGVAGGVDRAGENGDRSG